MNAIIYARFSPRPNAQESESIETQLDFCRRWCSQQGHAIAGEFSDRELSGADYERPGLWQAIEALRRGWLLVVYKFDRLCRDGPLWTEIERNVSKAGASIVSASGEGSIQDSMDPAEWLKVQMLKIISEYEAKMIRFRTSIAMQRHQASGRRMSNRPPYGCREDPSDESRWINDYTEQLVIRRILAEHAAGKKLREIGRLLADDKVTCRGGPWHHSTLAKIVRRAQRSACNSAQKQSQ